MMIFHACTRSRSRTRASRLRSEPSCPKAQQSEDAEKKTADWSLSAFKERHSARLGGLPVKLTSLQDLGVVVEHLGPVKLSVISLLCKTGREK